MTGETEKAALGPDPDRGSLEGLAVIIPSLNPDDKLLTVLDGMIAAGFSNLLVVDDGSQPDRQHYFDACRQRSACTLLRHSANRGKGRALKTAFTYLLEERPDIRGVITADGDNQHRPQDAVSLAGALGRHPESVIMGVRNFADPAVPLHNRLGNRLTSLVFRHLLGIPLSDTQTGLRAMSRDLMERLAQVEGERFEYESNVLLEMKKAAIPFVEVPIATIYIEDNATSHFRPVLDSIRIYGPILRFAGSSGASALVDLAAFSLLLWFLPPGWSLKGQIFAATSLARLLSSAVNYTLNRKAVFRSEAPTLRTLRRYYALCLVQMLASYGGVTLLAGLLRPGNAGKTALKFLVDSLLFLLSYRIQKEWVFSEKEGRPS